MLCVCFGAFCLFYFGYYVISFDLMVLFSYLLANSTGLPVRSVVVGLRAGCWPSEDWCGRPHTHQDYRLDFEYRNCILSSEMCGGGGVWCVVVVVVCGVWCVVCVLSC